MGTVLSVVLVGPPAAGKSTVALMLSQRLCMPYRSIDADRDRAARRYGYSSARAERLFVEEGAEAFCKYTSGFDYILTKRWLQEAPSIIDTSGGLIADDNKILRLVRTYRAIWVLVRPDVGDIDAWQRRLAPRPIAMLWWNRGGGALQLRALDVAATLANQDGVIVTDGCADEPLTSTVMARLQ